MQRQAANHLRRLLTARKSIRDTPCCRQATGQVIRVPRGACRAGHGSLAHLVPGGALAAGESAIADAAP